MSTLFDEGDRQRVEREATLAEQLPRQPIVEDRSPNEGMDFLLEAMMEVFRKRSA